MCECMFGVTSHPLGYLFLGLRGSALMLLELHMGNQGREKVGLDLLGQAMEGAKACTLSTTHFGRQKAAHFSPCSGEIQPPVYPSDSCILSPFS